MNRHHLNYGKNLVKSEAAGKIRGAGTEKDLGHVIRRARYQFPHEIPTKDAAAKSISRALISIDIRYGYNGCRVKTKRERLNN